MYSLSMCCFIFGVSLSEARTDRDKCPTPWGNVCISLSICLCVCMYVCMWLACSVCRLNVPENMPIQSITCSTHTQ